MIVTHSRGYHLLVKGLGRTQIASLWQSTSRQNSMLSWKVTDSLPLETGYQANFETKLKLLQTKLPTISSPSDVLVKVHATSVNPLDLRMVYGYGRRVLDLLDIATNYEPRITNDRYPLTLGRDFSGEVVATGPSVKHYKPGDLVFGVVEPQRSGAHAHYVSVPSYCLTAKPKNLNHIDAASIPFVALTTYSALCTFGNLSKSNCNGKQILVIGGSGGVGSFAIQLLKLWGANIVSTCSEEKVGWLENTLFVDQAICYNDLSQLDSLVGRFDFILDCGAYDKVHQTRREIIENALKYLKPYNQGVYVTLSPPILGNTDENGIVLGAAKTIVEAAMDTFAGLTSLNSARWAVFLPNKPALDYIASLYEDESLSAQVSSVFGFGSIQKAFEELQSGNAKGKIVVYVLKNESEQKSSRSSESVQNVNSAAGSELK